MIIDLQENFLIFCKNNIIVNNLDNNIFELIKNETNYDLIVFLNVNNDIKKTKHYKYFTLAFTFLFINILINNNFVYYQTKYKLEQTKQELQKLLLNNFSKSIHICLQIIKINNESYYNQIKESVIKVLDSFMLQMEKIHNYYEYDFEHQEQKHNDKYNDKDKLKEQNTKIKLKISYDNILKYSKDFYLNYVLLQNNLCMIINQEQLKIESIRNISFLLKIFNDFENLHNDIKFLNKTKNNKSFTFNLIPNIGVIKTFDLTTEIMEYFIEYCSTDNNFKIINNMFDIINDFCQSNDCNLPK